MRLPARLALVVVAGVALSACGASVSDSASPDHAAHGDSDVHPPAAGAEEATVTAVDIDFEPAKLSLKAGEPTNVTVVNKGDTLHDFTLDEAGIHVNVPSGNEVTTAVTVDKPGSYKAICTVPGHADAGMVVDVTVTE